MDIQEAYEAAVKEINTRADEIINEFREASGGMMSLKVAKEMAEKQWLYANVYTAKHKKKITPKEVKGPVNGNTKPTDHIAEL